MADDPVVLRALGRQVAAQQGIDPNDPSIDFAKYGKDAQYRIGKGQSVSPIDKFRVGHQQVRVPGHAAPRRAARGVSVPAPPPLEDAAPHRTVRVGAFELGFHGLEPARNRPQHKLRRTERSQGRYRVTLKYADPGYHDGTPRYLIDTERHVRAAWGYINQAKNARRYSREELRLIHWRIQNAGKRYGIEFGHARRRAATGHAAKPHQHVHRSRR